MGMLEVIWCVFVGHFLLFHSAGTVGLRNLHTLPYEISNDFIWFNTIFNPWRAQIPELSMKVPTVQVYCDESELILLVDKRLGEFILNRAEIILGDGCYSNSELPSQLMFTYGYDQCGTSHEMRKGLDIFSNTLHFNSREDSNMKRTLSVHVVCIPNGHGSKELNLPYQTPDKSRQFSIQAMDSSWTSAAESNTYSRGQVINIQVSATVQPYQQLFVQSCFISSSPDSRAKPRHAVIMNKGCTVPSGSPYTFIKFLDSDYSVVNFVLNSTYLIEESYIHCSALISDIGITSGSKSCNFDLVNSRWEELSGNVEVCRCCNSKCKGMSAKHRPRDAKAVVSTGPLFIVKRPVQPISESTLDSMQSDAATPEEKNTDTSVSTEYTKFQWPTLPNAVVVVKQDPVSSLTLVLPASNESSDSSVTLLNELQATNIEQETNLSNIKGQSSNLASDEPKQTEVRNELWRDNKYVKPQEQTNDAQPILRSKIQLSKNADGSQTLSYEEAVTLLDRGVIRKHGKAETGCKRRRAHRRLPSIFLNLLRRMDKVE
ncbi:zona pellucida protein C [Corythoichthys intestinalis]|uniref:zona pellucida protein C n=1 Tax=Corythoichthys intestinalis TaxID=161448 RepID=UPI0025A54D3F|nr:zona pellucida protein C [Corythoichthys intestinalis]